MSHRPPRLAQTLLRWVLPRENQDAVLSDLEELWAERMKTSGQRAANRWYWRQSFKSMQPAISCRLSRVRGGAGGPHPQNAMISAGNERLGFEGIRQDLRFAISQLQKRPGVGIVVVGTLAIGIGATATIFSAVNALLLRPLPYNAPSELVMIAREGAESAAGMQMSYPDLVDLRQEAPSIKEIIVFGEATVGPMTETERPEHVTTNRMSWNTLGVLGIRPGLGRDFVAEDELPLDSLAPVVSAALISHAFWVRAFGADPDILGRRVKIWGGDSRIVGVLPQGFQLLAPPEMNLGGDVDVWQAFRFDVSRLPRESRWFRAMGRLTTGATLRKAQAETSAFSNALRARFPFHAAEETSIQVSSVQASITRPIQGPLLLLMSAVILVLLIACVNVTNLLLARGTTRANEMAVRSALGARQSRLVRQLLTESGILAVAGALAGIGIALVGVQLLHALRPPEMHRFAEVRLDLVVLGFTAGVCVLTTLLSGLLPALVGARSGLANRLDARGVTGAGGRARRTLIVGEVALSVVLVVGAGLLIRTFSELQRMPLGFEPSQLLTVTATQPSRLRAERQAFEAELAEAVAAVPGVMASGIVFPLPMNGLYERVAEYVLPGREADPTAWRESYFRTVSPSYFETMGLTLRRGRMFDASDEILEVPVVTIDERFAQAEYGNEDPVGRQLFIRGMEGDTLYAEIVGVVEYSPQGDHRDVRPTMYFPRVQYQSHEVSVVARVSGDMGAVGTALMQAVKRVAPDVPSDLAPMNDYVSAKLAASRFLLVLMEVFAGVALVLSAVGLYGTLAYSVRQQTREFGVRLALGDTSVGVTARVVLHGLRLSAAGVAVGVLGALILGGSLEAHLFRVKAADPWALGGAVLLVLSVSTVASFLPALRASRVNPVQALRED